ncbi:MAG: hypothetical protein ABIG94_05615 [Pseudomonadota bacterium]
MLQNVEKHNHVYRRIGDRQRLIEIAGVKIIIPRFGQGGSIQLYVQSNPSGPNAIADIFPEDTLAAAHVDYRNWSPQTSIFILKGATYKPVTHHAEREPRVLVGWFANMLRLPKQSPFTKRRRWPKKEHEASPKLGAKPVYNLIEDAHLNLFSC